MFDPFTVITIFCIYIGILFVLGFLTEKNISLQNRLCNNPLIYSLALTVYLTSWTFYGLVGFAADSGLLFLTFYLSTTITAPFWWLIVRKLIYIKNQYAITSVADFISARYDKSAGIAALVTIIAFFGITPYIALQLRSIITTFDIITTTSSSTNTSTRSDSEPAKI